MTRRLRNSSRLALVPFALIGAAGRDLKGADCAACHEQPRKLARSAHAGLTCDTCHQAQQAGAAAGVPAKASGAHPYGMSKPGCVTCHQNQKGEYANGAHGLARKAGNDAAPDCGVCHGSAHELVDPRSAGFHAAVPDTCGMCHSDGAGRYKASVHGQAVARGIAQAPVCTDCHGEHRIIKPADPASPVHAAHIRETCGSCHGDVRLTREFGLPADRLVSFNESFHGLAAKSGRQTVANCASCHGVHNILAASDPKSTVYFGNLPKTCGQCHPGAGTRFSISQIHLVAGKTDPAPVRCVRGFYLLLIPAAIGLMLLHNLGHWCRKLILARFGKAPGGGPAVAIRYGVRREMRMLPFERVAHAALAISFLTLVWTGFALKYPDQVWARPLLLMESNNPVRSLLHRIAAAVFLAVAVARSISLIASRNLREHWKKIAPRANDLPEARENFAYNLGLRRSKPKRSALSYIERTEYWAVVWGGAVMSASGLLLWANNWALKHLPKLWLDVATSVHFYEAVLATLAIAVWHFYSVLFDPDVYPLDTAFLTGYSVKELKTEEAKAPAETSGE